MKQVTKKDNYGEALFIGWPWPEDEPGERTLWLTWGKDWGDFYGHTVAIQERDVPALIIALRGLKAKIKKPGRKRQ